VPKSSKPQPQLRSEQHQAALEEYEKGLRLFQQRDFKKAIPRFETILESYPDEGMLGDRARTYLNIARGESGKRKPVTSTRESEMSFEVGTWLLNDGQFKEAVRHLERAVEHEPEDDQVLVTLAAAQVGASDREGALRSLSVAFEKNPKARFKVTNMCDFDSLAGDEGFRALLHPED
jgi:tetratricopeptide (TPR) repeat protein